MLLKNLENFGFFSNRIELTEIMKEIKWDRYRFDPSIKVVYVYFFYRTGRRRARR